MSEWWTYTLADFLLFSPATYYRLFELHNRALWPAQLAALAAGVAILVLTHRGGAGAARAAALLLAAAWACAGWLFHFERYASINWAASWFGWAFCVQAVLLLAAATVPGAATRADQGSVPRRVGLGLAAFAILAMPLLAPLGGRTWVHAEIFALSPDPTAIATLGVLLRWNVRMRPVLLAVPLAWCALSGATLVAMHSAGAAVPVVAALATIAVIIRAASSTKGRLS